MKENAVNLVVDGLKEAGVEKVTISPREVKSLRRVERNVTWDEEKVNGKSCVEYQWRKYCY